jgi:hypothetical protein
MMNKTGLDAPRPAMFKLGLNAPRPGSIKMQFGSYLKATDVPTVPTAFGRPWLVRQWGMLGNDQEGDCFWAGACHESMMLRADADSNIPMFTTRTAFHDYHEATGTTDDIGTDLLDGMHYRQKTGISDTLGQRHKIDFYTELKPGDLHALDLAVFLFGVAGVGIKLPDSAEQQFNSMEVWSVMSGASLMGGHYVPCVGRNSLGNYLIVTWGRLQAVTPDWIQAYMDQGAVIISHERLKTSGISPQGFDWAKLQDDYHQLTGE